MLIKYTLIMKTLMSFFLVKRLYFVLTFDWGQNSRFICDFPTEFGDIFSFFSVSTVVENNGW